MSSDIVFPLTAKDFEKHCVLSECGISHLCVIVTNTQDSQNVNKKGLFWLYGGLALLLGAALSMCAIEPVTLWPGWKNNKKEERIWPPLSPEGKAP